jgi:hypothetical protein
VNILTKTHNHKKAYAAIAAVLVAAVIVCAAIFNPSFFSINNKLELASVSQTTLDPQGGSVGSDNALTGVYWNLYCTVEANDVIQGFLLPSGTAAATSVSGINQECSNTASVEVDVTPLQAYLIRDVTEQQVNYAPAAQGDSGTTPTAAQSLQYWTWNEASWRIYCEYQVTVKQNGNVIGTAVLNTQGNNAVTQQVQTNDGTILITNLGGLMGNYMEPETPTQACILNPDYVYDWAQIQQMVDDSFYSNGAATNYAAYWFGTARTSSGTAYDPTITIGTTSGHTYLSNQYGGWESLGSSNPNGVKPVAPVVYSSDKGNLPSDKLGYLSLTEWLQSKNEDNFASNPNGNGNNLNQYSISQFVTDTDGETALQLMIPWNAYETPTLDIKIPVSMADTIVERPQVSNIQVNGYWQSNGEKTLLNIGAGATLEVDLTQKSSVASSGLITVNSTDPRVQIIPTSDTETMASGATQTIDFTVSQGGGSTTDGTAANPIAITINSYDVDTGALESTDTVYCTLAATVGSGLATTLNIHVQDNSTAHSPIVGEAVFLEWPPSNGQTNTAYTDGSGNIVLTLSTSGGGGYSGRVQVTAETLAATKTSPSYPAQVVTDTVKPGQNSLTITMGSTPTKSSGGIDWLLIGIIIAIIAVVIIMIGIAAYASKHKGKRRR